ncbi:MAG TPA: phosphoribosylaminoimidazolesuccinocarboxamide synthase [Planctomycetes bacterium]|nr:phosphoribosylaminoimidazolesuccinocarboxamide synthase [Planctomycetota bacterium]
MTAQEAVRETNISELGKPKRGKVRDIYDLGENLLIVATDRISAFDAVIPTPIPLKGKILTQMAAFWFDMMRDILPNHLVTADVNAMPASVSGHADVLAGRTMLVRKTEPVKIECVIRGYLAGSGWNEYREKGTVCGMKLPAKLKSGSKLSEPIFTPATKADSGHDENITFEEAIDVVGEEIAGKMRMASLAIYTRARDYADARGIIIADTKFEFGLLDGTLYLIDEILTPDSSRFWPKDNYTPGGIQFSFDKQFVRDYLEACAWDKTPPAPELPEKVVSKTTEKYLDAFRRLTGRELET